MKLNLLLILFAITYFLSAHGQATDTIKVREVIAKRAICLLTGVSFGKNTFFDIGVSKTSRTVIGHHPFSSAYFASTELKFGGKSIIGPKIGAWATGGVGGMTMGVNMIYYTDFTNASVVFRPEIGFGFERFKFTYGYNAILTKHNLEGVNRNLGSIVYELEIRRLKEKTRSR